ncbi:MAG TPA: 50S ribosomal protein L7/L12 [Verrucomicrobiales bacterium]|nr:50S ribosomal protein L7/L12 [Verrucomicrobiales bacterium]
MAELDDIVTELSKLTVIEAAELVKKLEEEWGVSAAAPVAVAGGAGDAPAEEAKTEFDVVLAVSPSEKKIPVIKAVREVKSGLGLAEAKKLVESAPANILEGVSKEEAEAAKTKLEAVGAKIEIK